MSAEKMGQIALLYAERNANHDMMQNGGRRPTVGELEIIAPNLAEELGIPTADTLEFLKHIHRY
jgi:hypothetical protein